LTADPLELEDVMAERSKETAVFHQEIERLALNLNRQRDNLAAGENIELDERLRQQLRALGYID
jgi:hypothetical protein